MKNINGANLTESQCYTQHKRLIWSAIKNVIPIARKVGIDKDDVLSAASIGFIQAYRKFDDTLGYQFSTYAVPMIYGHAMRFVRENSNVVHYGRTILTLATRISREGLEGSSVREIAEQLDEPEQHVHYALLSRADTKSLQEYVYDTERVTLAEQLGVETDFTFIYVNEFISSLDKREQIIIEMRLDNANQREIGRALGVSQVQISRMLKKIGKKYKAVS